MSRKTRDEIMARYEAAAKDMDAGLTAEEVKQNLMTTFSLSDAEALDVLAALPQYLKHRGNQRDANDWRGFALFAIPLFLIVVALIVFGSYLSKDPLGLPAIAVYIFLFAGVIFVSCLLYRWSWYGSYGDPYYQGPSSIWFWLDLFDWW